MSLPSIDWSDLGSILNKVSRPESEKKVKSSLRKEPAVKVPRQENKQQEEEHEEELDVPSPPQTILKKSKKLAKAQAKEQQTQERARKAHAPPADSSEDESAENLFGNLSEEDSKPEPQDRRVTFEETVVVLNDPDKKWNSKIEDEKKGRFSPEEEQALSESIQRYCKVNNIPQDKMDEMIASHDNPGRSERLWTTICSVLPRRSLQSCFRFIKRRFNRNNYKGQWTPEETEELRVLYDELGPKWKAIAEKLHRTAENVRDKMYSLSSQTPELPFWSMAETVKLVRVVQERFDDSFVNETGKLEMNSGLAQLERESVNHDKLEGEERKKNRKYNSNTFVFHNLAALMSNLKFDVMKTLDFDLLKWRSISHEIPTKSKDQCRTKWRQIVGLQYIAYSPTTRQEDQQLIELISQQHPNCEDDIDFRLTNGRTSQENKQRWRVLKKFVEGRLRKSFREVLEGVRANVGNHPRLQSNKPRSFPVL